MMRADLGMDIVIGCTELTYFRWDLKHLGHQELSCLAATSANPQYKYSSNLSNTNSLFLTKHY